MKFSSDHSRGRTDCLSTSQLSANLAISLEVEALIIADEAIPNISSQTTTAVIVSPRIIETQCMPVTIILELTILPDSRSFYPSFALEAGHFILSLYFITSFNRLQIFLDYKVDWIGMSFWLFKMKKKKQLECSRYNKLKCKSILIQELFLKKNPLKQSHL